MNDDQKATPFVTFYSFKGGVGRSMALINTAGILAGRGFCVLVIDLDLEAPGLSYIDPDSPWEQHTQETLPPSNQPGFVDLLGNALDEGDNGDLFKLPAEEMVRRYARHLRFPKAMQGNEDGALHLMPAGKFDGHYAERLDSLHLGTLYKEGIGAPLIQAFKKRLADSGLYDYILVDSRTGFSDEAGICTRDLGDQLVVLSGLNRQNVEGTREFLETLRAATDGKKPFQIVLSPVPNGEDELFERREREARDAFDRAWGKPLPAPLQIPYHPQLALTEEPHIFRRRWGPLFRAYKAIEAQLLVLLGHTAAVFSRQISELISSREYVAALQESRHMVKLDRGREALGSIIGRSKLTNPSPTGEGDRPPAGDPVTAGNLLKDKAGLALVKFYVENLDFHEQVWHVEQWLQTACRAEPDLNRVLLDNLLRTSPLDAEVALEYAGFFEADGQHDFAEALYEKFVSEHPAHPDGCLQYADYLIRRNKPTAAERVYKLAAASGGVKVQEQYARFLYNQAGDFAGAEALFRTVRDKTRDTPSLLANHGQALAAIGQLAEAEVTLQRAVESLPESDHTHLAELCFALWIVQRMQDKPADLWERYFKWLLGKSFRRHSWNLGPLLQRAQGTLSAAEFDYAQAMAAAFASKRNVPPLEKHRRWQSVQAGRLNRYGRGGFSIW